MNRSRSPKEFLHKHSLSLAALGVVVLLIALFCWSNPATHIGSFFGNAIADWTGVFITIVITKHLYEKGSAESKQPKDKARLAAGEFPRSTRLPYFFWSPASPGWWHSGPWTRAASGAKSSATSSQSGRRFSGSSS